MGPLAWDLGLGIFDLGSLVLDLLICFGDLWLEIFCFASLALDFRLGILGVGALAWDLWFRFVGLRSSAWDLDFGELGPSK